MDDQFFKYVSTLGFPIAVASFLLFKLGNKVDDLLKQSATIFEMLTELRVRVKYLEDRNTRVDSEKEANG